MHSIPLPTGFFCTGSAPRTGGPTIVPSWLPFRMPCVWLATQSQQSIEASYSFPVMWFMRFSGAGVGGGPDLRGLSFAEPGSGSRCCRRACTSRDGGRCVRNRTTTPARGQLLKTRYRESRRHAKARTAGTGNVEIGISRADLPGRACLDRGRRATVGRPLSGRSAS